MELFTRFVATVLFGIPLIVWGDELPSDDRLVHEFLQVEMSPDGSRIAAVEGDAPINGRLPPVRELVIRPVKGGGETRVELPCGHEPQCWPGSPTWTTDGKRLSFTLRTPGSHAYSLYTVAADGTGLIKTFDFGGTIQHLQYMPDGRLVMLATANARKEMGATEAGTPISGDLDAPPAEQRIAVLENGSLRWASPPDLFVYEFDKRPDNEGFVGTAAPGDGDANWWTAKLYAFAPGSGTAQVLYTPASSQQQIATPKVSRDGRTVVFIAGIMSDFSSTGGDVYSMPISGGTATDIMSGVAASARSLTWSCSGHLLVEWLAGGATQFVDMGAPNHSTAGKVLWSGEETLTTAKAALSQACPSTTTVTAHETFTSPPELEVGAVGHWHDLTAANRGLTMPAHVQSLHWKSGGFDVQGWLLLPDKPVASANGKIPMITSIHGGPAAANVPMFQGPSVTRTLLEHGYAWFYPNPRGSFGQGERFTLANVRDFGYGDLADVLAGIDAAEKAAPIDEGRLGIMGGSYGGFMTMWAITQTNRFKAAVAGAGISDWLSYYGENGIDAWMLPYFGASVYNDPEIYAKSSAINFIRNVHTPAFEYVGERDIECPAPQTQEFWHALKELGVPTEVMIYPGEGHGLREVDHVTDLMQRTLTWFDRYLR